MENKIIAFYDEKKNAFTDSKIISIFANVEHKSVKRIINNHKKDFLTFGKIDSLNIKEYQVKEFKENFHVILPISNKEFSDFKSRNYLTGRPENFYLLNEEQATLLITYLKNTKQVREFKKELVKEFYRLKKENYKFKLQRELEKPIRKKLTDTIQNWKHFNKYSYKNITDLILKNSIGLNAREIKEKRGNNSKTAIDLLDCEELKKYVELEQEVIILLKYDFDYTTIKDLILKKRLKNVA